ncbi:MAG: hypothetical protein QGG40_03720 [Myxococcota bacterium]|nr:hypothetical protein [Myxococcota bacterium]
MRSTVIQNLRVGQSLTELVELLDGVDFKGRALRIELEGRAHPFADHTVEGWVDGPPGSNVLAVLSGADPQGAGWRRFTLSRVGPWRVELGAFPTPFHNAEAPLSPGIPPSASRRRSMD